MLVGIVIYYRKQVHYHCKGTEQQNKSIKDTIQKILEVTMNIVHIDIAIEAVSRHFDLHIGIEKRSETVHKALIFTIDFNAV